MFFQNVDAIIGNDDAIVYPDHLTSEMDYELELAIVCPVNVFKEKDCGISCRDVLEV